MRADPYLVFNGVELSNGNRVLNYMINLAGGSFEIPGCEARVLDNCEPVGYVDEYEDVYTPDTTCELPSACCFCSALDFSTTVVTEGYDSGNYNDGGYDNNATVTVYPASYVSPAADVLNPAPWYQASRPESAEFLGFFASEPRLLPVPVHSVSPRSGRGGILGPYSLKPRVMVVRGHLIATTPRGMSYGERWLTQALLGTHCLPPESCNSKTLRFLPACPEVATEAEAIPFFRTLVNVELTDGPIFSPVISNEAVLQEVSFELTAGQPYLFTEGETLMAATVSL